MQVTWNKAMKKAQKVESSYTVGLLQLTENEWLLLITASAEVDSAKI